MSRSVLIKSSAVAVATVAAGVSSLFLSAAPAVAAPPPCGAGTLLAGNICEQTFTSGTSDFTPGPGISNLQVLLVGGGGSGVNHSPGFSIPPATTIPEYGPNGGGGGDVKVVDFSAETSTTLHLTVGGSGGTSSVNDGTTTTTAAGGSSGTDAAGGDSGSGKAGWSTTSPAGAGAGAGASPANEFNGGAGKTPAAVAPSGSIFATDVTCYGGGGAIGFHSGTIGSASCGGGTLTDGATSTSLTAPTVNHGGGGAGGDVGTANAASTAGASGAVVVRWTPPTVTLTFASSHGSAVAPETVTVGAAPTRPTDPVVDGFVFKGWFTDPGLTTPADFSAPLTADATFFPSFGIVLATTGGVISPLEVPLGLGGLGAGIAVVAAVAINRRRARVTL